MSVSAVVFDVGNVLYRWSPRALYERLIPDDQALDAFLDTVLTMDWHIQHDAGRDFADTSAELIAKHPEHRDLILAWNDHFGDTITGMVPGMREIVEELDARGVPLFAITNFSHEFWVPFSLGEANIFDRFRDIVVSGEVKMMKPDPAIYALALDRFGLEPNNAIFIDDSQPNANAGAANGFIGHHFTDAATLRTELVNLGLL